MCVMSVLTYAAATLTLKKQRIVITTSKRPTHVEPTELDQHDNISVLRNIMYYVYLA